MSTSFTCPHILHVLCLVFRIYLFNSSTYLTRLPVYPVFPFYPSICLIHLMILILVLFYLFDLLICFTGLLLLPVYLVTLFTCFNSLHIKPVSQCYPSTQLNTFKHLTCLLVLPAPVLPVYLIYPNTYFTCPPFYMPFGFTH